MEEKSKDMFECIETLYSEFERIKGLSEECIEECIQYSFQEAYSDLLNTKKDFNVCGVHFINTRTSYYTSSCINTIIGLIYNPHPFSIQCRIYYGACTWDMYTLSPKKCQFLVKGMIIPQFLLIQHTLRIYCAHPIQIIGAILDDTLERKIKAHIYDGNYLLIPMKNEYIIYKNGDAHLFYEEEYPHRVSRFPKHLRWFFPDMWEKSRTLKRTALLKDEILFSKS